MATIAKTVGSFDKVLASCKTIGAQYQPNVAELSLTALSQLHDRAQQSLGAVTATRIAYLMAVNDRKKSFEGISKLAVRVVRMMTVYSRGNSTHLEDAVRIKRNLSSPDKRPKSAKVAATSTGEPAQATRASGRLSYDQQMDTFSNLVELAAKTGTYYPVVPDLTLQSLQQKLADLRNRSHAVNEARAAFKKARLERDQLISGKDGIREITKAVKGYILGTFGTISDEARHIKGEAV